MLKRLYGWKENTENTEFTIISALFGENDVESIWDEEVALFPKIISIIEKNGLKDHANVSIGSYALSVSFSFEPKEDLSKVIHAAADQIDQLFEV